jgi:large subunit ribosomal protein L29
MKMAEFRAMSDVELAQALEDKREALFNLRFQKARNTLANKHAIRMVKRDIARINTLTVEKQKKS